MARKHEGLQIEASRLRMEKRINHLSEIAEGRNDYIKTQKQDPDWILRWEVTTKNKLNPSMFPTATLVLRKYPRPQK